MAYIYIQEDELTCPLCTLFLTDPIECRKCKNNFCRKCVNELKEFNKRNNNPNICPSCRNEWNLEENHLFRQIILDKIQLICPKCKKPFHNKNLLNEHMKKCKKYTCKVCHENYFTNEFLNHIMDSHNEIILKLANKNFKGDPFPKILNTIIHPNVKPIEFNSKDSNDASNENENNNINNDNNFAMSNFPKGKDKNESNYEKGEYINYFRPKNEIPYPNENLIIPSNKILSINNLYYCGKNTNLNCDCCVDGKCKVNNCLCKSCMDFNKKIKFLKDYYLINKNARAAKYGFGSFRCLSEYINITQVNGIKMKKQIICAPPNEPCPGCKSLNKLYKKYLSPEVYKNFK